MAGFEAALGKTPSLDFPVFRNARFQFTLLRMAAPSRGPLKERATGAFSVNVKLPPRNDTGSAHVTRFQYKAPPLLMGELVALSCQHGCTVAQLKAMLKGAVPL